jgi:hypothetical protein
MTSDEQEALSRKYGNDMIMLLPLKSGRIAVFNAERTLCGIVDDRDGIGPREDYTVWEKAVVCHFPPAPRNVTLKDLGL